MAFNVKRFLIKVRGGQYYLPIAARLVWFREEHPDWSIETTPVKIDTESRMAIFQAVVKDSNGRVIATGTKMETGGDFADYLEKSETRAIGRALAVCGFGTQFAPELTEGEFIDSPLPHREAAEPEQPMICADCGATLKKAQYDLSMAKFKRPLCPNCQRKAVAATPG